MLFRDTASAVAAESLAGSLFLRLTEQFAYVQGHKPSPAEARSWESSIPVLARALEDAGLGQVEMLLEYGLPLTSKRVDVVLAGIHPGSGESSYVVVELKQWGNALPDDEDPSLCRIDAYARPVLNPIEQVRGYCRYLADFNGTLAGHTDRLRGVAYLHNATEFGVSGLYEAGQDEYGQLFTAERRGELLGFLRSRFAPASGAEAGDALLNGKVGPSRQLMDVAAQEVREREQFVLLDEQRIAYRIVLNAVQQAKSADQKRVLVVTGGPGSGKSVIALSLLGELYRRGTTALHATGSQSFTKTMRKVAGARKREVQYLFRYFNSFMSAERNGLDVLICDEAHRIRETSANRYTPARSRTGKAQIDELIDAARVPVFLLDEHQVVRPGELGTVADIKSAAAAKGLTCQVVRTDGQFRCGGSEAYLSWVVRLLGLEPGGPAPWSPDDRMELRIAETPHELEVFLDRQRAKGYTARMSAGYCWEWSREAPAGGNALPADVVIGEWARPWNVYGDRAVAGAPPAALWATDPAGFGQVGCVYTAQGFEYDWNGVIIGPDLVWRNDRWVTVRQESKDPVFKKSTPEADVDRLIRNTYKVLLTRGMVGTVVYSTDAETRQKLRDLVESDVT